jgi:hypothetical protein
MPKIPEVVSQGNLPDSGFTTARLQAPRNEGAGFAALGNDMQSIALLYPSFQHAQAQRDAVSQKAQAFERSLQAGTEIIATRGEMTKAVQAAMTQMDASGRYDQISYADDAGNTFTADPQTYLANKLGTLYAGRMNDMLQHYDPGTVAQIGNEMEKEAVSALSQFSTAVLTKRVQSGQARLSDQLTSLKQLASDPTDPRRDSHELLGISLIDEAAKQGILDPKTAGGLRQEFTAGIHDTRWSVIAQTNPERILGIQSDLASKQDYSLPAGMDPSKFDTYLKLAQGTLATRQSQATRAQEEMAKATDERQAQLESDLTSAAYRGDIAQDLEAKRLQLGNQRYGELMKLNRTLAEAREKDVTRDDTRRSKDNRFPMMVQAKGTKFTGDFSSMNEQVVSRRVANGDLTPEDGEAIVSALADARSYQRTADSDANRQIGKAEQSLKANFFVPANETKYSSQVKDLEAQALSRFYTEIERNPKQDPYVLSEQIMSVYRPLVIRSKQVTIEELAGQLQGAMKQFPSELFVPGRIKLDDAKVEQAVRSGALSRAAVKQYQSIYQTRQDLIEDQDMKAMQKEMDTPKPKPKSGFFGKGQ